MARVSKQKVHAALERAAQNILSAAGDDPVISRQDIRNKLLELEGVEQQLTSIFYRLVDHRDYKPGARITKADIDSTLAYAKTKMIDAYDKNNNGLSAAEIAKMSLTARLAVRLAKLQNTSTNDSGDTDSLFDRLRELGNGLYFPAWADEGEARLTTFHQDASLTTLTRESFSAAVGLDPTDRTEMIQLWHQGRSEYQWIFDNYENYEQFADLEVFTTVHQYMQDNLRQLTHIIVGLDGTRRTSEYPVYFVGLTPGGDILGYETFTVWT